MSIKTAGNTNCGIMKLALYDSENNLQIHSTQVNIKDFANERRQAQKHTKLFYT